MAEWNDDVQRLIDAINAWSAADRGRYTISDDERRVLESDIVELENRTGVRFGHSPFHKRPIHAQPSIGYVANLVHYDSIKDFFESHDHDGTYIYLPHYVGCVVDIIYENGILVDAIGVDDVVYGQRIIEYVVQDMSVPKQIAEAAPCTIRGVVVSYKWYWQSMYKDGPGIVRESMKRIVGALRCEEDSSMLLSNLCFVAQGIMQPSGMVMRSNERLQTWGFMTTTERGADKLEDIPKPRLCMDDMLCDGVLITTPSMRTNNEYLLWRHDEHGLWTTCTGYRWTVNYSGICVLRIYFDEAGILNKLVHVAFWRPGICDIAKSVYDKQLIYAHSQTGEPSLILDAIPAPGSSVIDIPTTCPICGCKIKKEKVYKCVSAKCASRLTSLIQRFCSPNGMNIPTLNPADVKSIIAAGLISDVSDLYTLTIGDLTSASISVTRAGMIIEEIQLSRHADLAHVLYALPAGFGPDIIEAIAPYYDSFTELMNATSREMRMRTKKSLYFCQKIVRTLHHNQRITKLAQWIL